MKISIKNNVWNGARIGLWAPTLPAILVWFLMQSVAVLQNADWLWIVAIAINALLMNYFFKHDKDNVARGIISATFLWAMAFFFYKVLQ